MRKKISHLVLGLMHLPSYLQIANEGRYETTWTEGVGEVEEEEIISEHVSGSRVVITGAGATQPLNVSDPAAICRHVEFYDTNGELIRGAASFSAAIDDPFQPGYRSIPPRTEGDGTRCGGLWSISSNSQVLAVFPNQEPSYETTSSAIVARRLSPDRPWSIFSGLDLEVEKA